MARFFLCWHLHKPSCFLFQEIRAVGTELGITPVIIRGEELNQKGFGGTFTGDIYSRLNHLYLMLALCLSLSECHYFSLSQINTEHLVLFCPFRYLWSWEGSRTSSCISSPKPQT